ncbi:RNA-binding protein Musashi homolog 2-like isoform X3 [Rhopilema esculentum]|uniref:RNA-binding protein Musashi homolog 2-like isoform X3 n=1 Tax=Rhopilema esculentum TaxID=499914 RepID=UPI0031E09427
MKDIEKEEPMCSTDSDDMDQEKPEHRSGKMFIGGLHSQTDSDSLENYFKQYGAIKESVIMRDPVTRRSRGFGFVTFLNSSSVDKVVKKANHMVDGKKVDPKIAIPRKVPKQNQFKKIFIGGLASDTTTNDVREYFEKYGKVTDVLLMYDKQTRRLRGFGFVSFESEEVAKRICGEGFHKIKSKSVECKRAQPKEVMQALQGRGRAGPYFGVDLSQFSFPRWYTQYGAPMPFYSGQEWPQMNAHMYQQLAKMEGFHSFPPGSGGFMNMTERRTETSPQHGYYRSSFGSIRNPDVRARSDQNPQNNSVTSSSISNMQEYDYGVQMNQYHQHGQGNLAPNPSPLSHGGMNPINSPGPVEYISATRTGAAAPHDFAVYSNSVGFGNGMGRFSNKAKVIFKQSNTHQVSSLVSNPGKEDGDQKKINYKLWNFKSSF